jgi:hypothetical protein
MPSMPQARRIPLNRRLYIIGFQSLPAGAIQHESALERDFVTLLSILDPSAIIRSQPVTIGFGDRGLRRCYTPDLGLRRAECTELGRSSTRKT